MSGSTKRQCDRALHLRPARARLETFALRLLSGSVAGKSHSEVARDNAAEPQAWRQGGRADRRARPLVAEGAQALEDRELEHRRAEEDGEVPRERGPEEEQACPRR